MEDSPFFGRMNDPTAAAVLRGPCGDEMEMYLVVRKGIIEDIVYYTEGCQHTRSYGLAVAKRAKGKTIWDALGISPKIIIDSEQTLAEDERHCAILAVSTLYRAIADYLLAP